MKSKTSWDLTNTMIDIPTWCRINGHQVLASEQLEQEFIFLVQKDPDGD